MSKEKQTDLITDLLIDFDEMGFAPTTIVPDPDAYARDWRNRLTNALQDYRKQSEVAREIFEEIFEDCFDQYGYINYEALAELRKKYTEGKVMTEHKFTDEEVIKALSCCGLYDRACYRCPLLHENCSTLFESATNIIKRQKAEIQRLREFEHMYNDLCK